MFEWGTEDRTSLHVYSSSQQICGMCDHWDKIHSSLTGFYNPPTTDSECCATTPTEEHKKSREVAG